MTTATLNAQDWPAAKVKLWPLAKLTPYLNNARTHTKEQIEEVAASIKEWGWTVPVLIDPEGERSTLVKTRVLATSSKVAELVKITLESGRTIRCTPDHRWVRNPNSFNGNWRFGPAQVGDYLAHVIEPWESKPITPEGAWLGGLYDGEGHEATIAQSRTHNPEVCERIEQVLDMLGISYTENVGTNATKFRIGEGRRGLARFIDLARPIRGYKLDEMILTTRYRTKDRVVSIEPDGVEPVFCLQTEAGSYVAWGYASSNCAIYDYQYQYGVPVMEMRVSNVHHETAVKTLYYLQEIEGDTWNRITARISGLNTAKILREDFMAPKELPWMFRDWKEYRDHLLENLITDPEIRECFRKQFKDSEALFDEEIHDELVKTHLKMLLRNNYHDNALRLFQASHGKYTKASKHPAKARKDRDQPNP
jgi:hypothetical protein